MPPVSVQQADLTDVSGVTWQWASSSSKNGTYANIDEAILKTYTPKPADVGKYLRVTASYNDGEGKYKRTVEILDNKVLAKDYDNQMPEFQGLGRQ